MGHHPAYPVNSYTNLGTADAGGFIEQAIIGSKQVAGVPMFRWHILPDNTRAFWDVLKRHNVLAYVCSHIIAYDVQVYDGVLQVCTAVPAPIGARTARCRAQPSICTCCKARSTTAACGIRSSIRTATLREWLQWPVELAAASSWQVDPGRHCARACQAGRLGIPPDVQHALAFDFRGTLGAGSGENQTLLSAWDDNEGPHIFWVGLTDSDQRLEVRMVPKAGDGDRVWRGPSLGTGGPLDLQLLVHTGMGPGGIMYRTREACAVDVRSSQHLARRGCHDVAGTLGRRQ